MSEEEEPEREAVRECYAELCKRMDPKGLRRRLFSEGLLTDEQNGAVQDLQNTSDKNEKLLVAIRQRSGKDIVLFCKILFEEKQEHCGDLLMNALKKYKIDISDLQRFKKTSRPPVPAHRVPQYMYRLQQLDTPFASLVTSVKKAVVTCEDFSTWSISLLTALKARSPHNEKVENAIVNIQDSSSEDKIFTYLQPFFDPIDVRLIENLIELLVEDSQVDQESESKRRLQVHDVQEKLHSYKSKVEDACTITLSKCKKDVVNDERPKNGMYVGFQTSLEPEVVTVNKILNLKEYLVDDIGVEEALFEGFSCSNVSLFFSIKLERLAFLIHWCYLHRQDLIEKFNVTLVFVPGHFVYSMEADQEYPFPEVGTPVKLAAPQQEAMDIIMLSEMKEVLDRVQESVDYVKHQKLSMTMKEKAHEPTVILEKISELQKVILDLSWKRESEPQDVLEKVLTRLNSLEAFVNSEGDGEKGTLTHSIKHMDSRLDDFFGDMEKQKASFEGFAIRFKELGDEFISDYQKAVEKQMHAMEKPFQIEIPMDMSHMVIGSRGQTLRRIEKKTGVQKMAVIPSTIKKGCAIVTLFGEPAACERAKVEVRILLANFVNMSKKTIIVVSYFSEKQMVSFRGLRAHEDVLQKKHYRLVPVGEKEVCEELRNLEVLGRGISEALGELLKSPTVPQVVIEARLGELFWKTDSALTKDDIERKYSIEQFEKDGVLNVEPVLGVNHWTFQTVCKTPVSEENVIPVVNAEQLGLISVGEMETLRFTFVHVPEEAEKDCVLYGLTAKISSEGKCEFIRIVPRMKKDIMFDCLPLEGNLDIRIALSSGPACSEEDRAKMTEFASEITKGMTVKEGVLFLDTPRTDYRVTHVRQSKRKLYLMNHEGYQYMLVDSDIKDCHVGRYSLPDDSAEYPLKDCHREMELWNCQWMADFALLEKKDWREFFISSGCDVSKIKVTPKPVDPENIVKELGPYYRCALRIAQA